MSWVTPLVLPWYGLRRSLRVILVLAWLLAWAVAFAVVHFAQPRWPNGWLAATVALAFWLALLGLQLSSVLLPALEARRLCLPRLERAAVLGLLLNALLLLTLTATPLALLSGHPSPVLEILLMGLAAGVAYGLWPPLWLVPVWMAFPLVKTFAPSWHWRPIAPQDGRFIGVCLAVLTAAVTVSAWHWRRVLRAAPGVITWGMRPTILSFQMSRQCGSGASPGLDPQIRRARQVPEWLLPQADLGDAGPRNLPRALRVMLGGLYLPVTWRSRLRHVSAAAAIPALTAIFFLPMGLHAGWHWRTVRPFVTLACIFGPGMAMAIGTMARSQHLVQRWRRPAGELAVVPLLPGLGEGVTQRARLLRLLMSQMRTWHGLSLAVAVLAARWLGADWAAIGLLVLVLGLAPLAEQVVVYSTLGRRPVRGWAYWSLLVLGTVTYVGGLNVASVLLTGPAHRGPASDSLVPLLLAVCALCYVVMLALVVRGRYALQRQAYPYLALE